MLHHNCLLFNFLLHLSGSSCCQVLTEKEKERESACVPVCETKRIHFLCVRDHQCCSEVNHIKLEKCFIFKDHNAKLFPYKTSYIKKKMDASFPILTYSITEIYDNLQYLFAASLLLQSQKCHIRCNRYD
jgi:hypothetical protein